MQDGSFPYDLRKVSPCYAFSAQEYLECNLFAWAKVGHTGELHSVISDLVCLATETKHWLILCYPIIILPVGMGCNTVQPPTKTTYVWKQTDTGWMSSSQWNPFKGTFVAVFSPPPWSSEQDEKSWRGLCCQIWLITNLQRLILLILHSYDVRKWPRCAFC